MSIIDTLRIPKIPFTQFILFDWLFTIIFAWLFVKFLARYNKVKYNNKNIFITLAALLVLSVALHVYFDVPTVTNYYLGLSRYPSRP